jgi:hypothetical protein
VDTGSREENASKQKASAHIMGGDAFFASVLSQIHALREQ